MRLKIGKHEFWMQDKGGYIYLESEGKPGTLGRQICDGGEFLGNTVQADPEHFEQACRSWHRAALRNRRAEVV